MHKPAQAGSWPLTEKRAERGFLKSQLSPVRLHHSVWPCWQFFMVKLCCLRRWATTTLPFFFLYMSKSVVLNYIIISFACVFFMWTWRYSHQPTLIPQPISQVFLPTGLNESRMSDDWLHSNPQSEINAYVLKWYIPLSWMNIMGSYDYCYWLSFIADLKCLKDTAACAFDCTNNLFSIFFLC